MFHGNCKCTSGTITLLYIHVTSGNYLPSRLAGTRTRLRRPAYAIAANFNMPEVPATANPKAVEVANKIKDGLMETIKKLFSNRPIWSRAALQCHLTSASQERMKQLLAVIAYYWLNGPWRTLWTRIGYDPRKDPSAKM